jgi:hypothetical protein
MLIENKGNTQTKIYNNNNYKTNEIKWDANYDGKIADINLDVNNNGEKKSLQMNLNNEDLAELLNIPSVGLDLQKRLKNDFTYSPSKKPNYMEPNFIELKKDITTSTSTTDEPMENIDIFHKKIMKKYNPTPKTYYKKYSKKFSIKRNRKYKPKTNKVYFRKKTSI